MIVKEWPIYYFILNLTVIMPTIRNSFLFFLFITLLAPLGAQLSIDPNPAAAGFSSERLERYDDFLSGEIDAGRLVGAISYVKRKGHTAHRATYGYADREQDAPMTDDKFFHLMSMTKPIVSVAFMMLYEEGHFELTDRLDKYLPAAANLTVALNPADGLEGETEPINQPIRIHHLLTHTAGLSHGLSGSPLDNAIAMALYFQPQENIESRVNTLFQMPLVLQPGEKWFYSAAPDVLALLIEKFSGMTAEAFLKERIFTPLGMNDTGYNIPDDQMERRAQVYTPNPENGQLIPSPMGMGMTGNTVHGGTHGLISTVDDYMVFCQMLLNGGEWAGKRYLGRKTLELMTIDHVGDKRSDAGQGFGLGFGVTTDLAEQGAPGSVGQYYWSGAYSTYFFIDPKEELIAILMTQTSPYSNYYSNKLRQMVYQAIDD